MPGEIAAGIAVNLSLTTLEYDDQNVGDLSCVAKALCPNSTLTSLMIMGEKHAHESGITLIEALQTNSVLRKLHLRCMDHLAFEDDALATMLKKNSSLRCFDTSFTHEGTSAEPFPKTMLALETNTTLQTLSFRPMKPAALQVKNVLMKNKTLSEFGISIDVREYQQISDCAAKNYSLTEFVCHEVIMTDEEKAKFEGIKSECDQGWEKCRKRNKMLAKKVQRVAVEMFSALLLCAQILSPANFWIPDELKGYILKLCFDPENMLTDQQIAAVVAFAQEKRILQVSSKQQFFKETGCHNFQHAEHPTLISMPEIK